MSKLVIFLCLGAAVLVMGSTPSLYAHSRLPRSRVIAKASPTALIVSEVKELKGKVGETFNCSTSYITTHLNEIYTQILPIYAGMAADYDWAQIECGNVANYIDTDLALAQNQFTVSLDPALRSLYICLNAQCSQTEVMQLVNTAILQANMVGATLQEVYALAVDCPGTPDIANWASASVFTLTNTLVQQLQNIEQCN